MFNLYMILIIATNLQIYRFIAKGEKVKKIYGINTIIITIILFIIAYIINLTNNLFRSSLDNITLLFICTYLTITAIKILIKILKEKKMVK